MFFDFSLEACLLPDLCDLLCLSLSLPVFAFMTEPYADRVCPPSSSDSSSLLSSSLDSSSSSIIASIDAVMYFDVIAKSCGLVFVSLRDYSRKSKSICRRAIGIYLEFVVSLAVC